MGKLKVLPGNLANLIAAGEVVQRPASVVKELMENSVDAGASALTVIITDSGRTLIQVIDNGCGMSKADAVLCFERHATSKIASAEDLQGILTYGFRGEALPSIAAVADITLKTRREADQTGTQVKLSGKMEESECSCPVGCNIAVRNLFYNTPARRKFLKTDSIEFKHIVEEFTHVALSYPDKAFTLLHNGKEIFVLKAAKSLKYRIQDILGNSMAGNLVEIDITTALLRISGFIGKPDAAKKTPGDQYFFVNGRYFRSSYLHKAVIKAYEGLIPEGVNPAYFLFIDIDPSTVDVNIHPAKTEIKFEDDSLIFQTLYACVKEVLGKSSFRASLDFEDDGTAPLPQFGESFSQYRGTVKDPTPAFNPNYNPFNTGSFAEGNASETGSRWQGGSFGSNCGSGSSGSFGRKTEDFGALFNENVPETNRPVIVGGKYILTPVPAGVLVVNIHRAQERIFFDRALEALSKEGHISQAAMFPVQINVGVEDRLLFEDNAELLSKLGFDISTFGNDSIVVGGVPEGYSCEEGKIRQLVSDLTLILSDGTVTLSELLQASMARKFATLWASHAETLHTGEEARLLLDTLFASSNSETTSDGRRITVILGAEDFDKKF